MNRRLLETLTRLIPAGLYDDYLGNGGCTRLDPLPQTPEKIQRVIRDRAKKKRVAKKMKRIERWMGGRED